MLTWLYYSQLGIISNTLLLRYVKIDFFVNENDNLYAVKHIDFVLSFPYIATHSLIGIMLQAVEQLIQLHQLWLEQQMFMLNGQLIDTY